MKFISSNGGSYLIMEANQLNNWPGAADMKVYDSIPHGADEGLITTVNNIPVILLGAPDNMHACKVKDGALFVTIVSCDDEKDISKIINKPPTENWKSRGLFTVMDNISVFDSAISGNDISEDNSFALNIATGEHEAFAQNISSDSYELQLLFLRLKTPVKSNVKKAPSSSDTSKKEAIKPKIIEAAVKTAYNNVAPFPQIKYQDLPNGRSFLIGDIPYAKVELIDQEIHYQIRKPRKLNEDLSSRLGFYTEQEIDGVIWLTISTPANNKPGIILEAGLGRFAGSCMRELCEELGIQL